MGVAEDWEEGGKSFPPGCWANLVLLFDIEFDLLSGERSHPRSKAGEG